MNRSSIHIHQRTEWVNKNTNTISFNGNNDPYYHESSTQKTTTIGQGSLNYCKWDLSRLNDIFNSEYDDKNTSTFDFSSESDAKACIGTTASLTKRKSNSQTDASCPPGTKYEGANVYSWMDVENSGFSDGIPLSEAILKVCDGQLGPPEEEDRHYSEIKNGRGCSMDDCLIAGNPRDFCEQTACLIYDCKYTIAGKTVTMYNQLSVYKEIYEQIKSGTLQNWRTILESNANGEQELEDEIRKIAKKVCETEQCNDGGKNPFVYRTIQLNLGQDWNISFPSITGEGRKFGSNWNEHTVQTVLNRNNIDESKPMYRITLTPATIRQIRNYNGSQNGYDTNLDCNSDGSACISSFLRGNELQGNIEGKCAGISKSNFYSCTNY